MSNITELRRLIVGPQVNDIVDQVDHLNERLDNLDQRAKDVQEVLPSVIIEGGNDLSEALQAPVSAAMRRSIERNPEDIADLLFPVMGPSIRRAISEAINSMMKSINEMLEATLTVRGLKWRIESFQTGVPYAEVALNHTLVYRVEQVFLIQNDSGMLVAHTAAPGVSARDSDAVSAMFTAIQDFARHSFADNETDSLREIEVGGQTVWSVPGPYAMLVAVIRGVPPNAMRGRFVTVLEEIHGKNGRALRRYGKDDKPIPGLESQLEDCIELEFQSDAKASRANDKKASPAEPVSPWINILRYSLLTFVTAGVVAFAYSSWQTSQQRAAAVTLIDATPGIVVTRVGESDGRLLIEGMGDPLAKINAAAVAETGVDPASIQYQLEAYQSLEAPIVVMRARRLLNMPASVTATLDQGALRLRGSSPSQWLTEARATQVAIAGITAIDFSAVETQR